MTKYLCAIAALACLTVAPVLTTPANAQVSIELGIDGPAIRLGPDNRDVDRDRYRSRRYDRSDWDDCREVTQRTLQPDGSTSVSTTRRCD